MRIECETSINIRNHNSTASTPDFLEWSVTSWQFSDHKIYNYNPTRSNTFGPPVWILDKGNRMLGGHTLRFKGALRTYCVGTTDAKLPVENYHFLLLLKVVAPSSYYDHKSIRRITNDNSFPALTCSLDQIYLSCLHSYIYWLRIILTMSKLTARL